MLNRIWVRTLDEVEKNSFIALPVNPTGMQSILKESSPEYSLKAVMLKLKFKNFGHLLQRTDSLEKTLMLGKIEGRRRGWQRMRWLPCPSPTPRAYSNSHPSSQWCHQHANPLLSPSPPAFNLSQHQGLFQWVSSSHQVAKVLEFQLQHQYFQWIFRTDFL